MSVVVQALHQIQHELLMLVKVNRRVCVDVVRYCTRTHLLEQSLSDSLPTGVLMSVYRMCHDSGTITIGRKFDYTSCVLAFGQRLKNG